MKQLTFKKFFYSNKNITGVALASLAMVLFLFGIIDAFVWPIVVGFYVFGIMVGPKEKTTVFYHLSGENLDDYSGFLNRLAKNSEQHIPHDAQKILVNIVMNGQELISFIQKDPKVVGFINEDFLNVKKIFDDYLPRLINQYIKLPRRYAEGVKTKVGKTSKEMLIDQLIILDKEVEKISYAIYENDAQALKIHGRILEQKFASKDLFHLNVEKSMEMGS